jgi:hypothetical protein
VQPKHSLGPARVLSLLERKSFNEETSLYTD